MDKRKAKCSSYGMFTGIFGIVGLGIVFGALLGIPFKPADGWSQSAIAALGATGIAIAYVVLSAIDWLAQWFALSKNPLPEDLDLSDRAVARERCAALAGRALLQRHIRRLLTAWAGGASGPQVAAMAANQMFRLLAMLAAEAIAIFVLLYAAAGFIAMLAIAIRWRRIPPATLNRTCWPASATIPPPPPAPSSPATRPSRWPIPPPASPLPRPSSPTS